MSARARIAIVGALAVLGCARKSTDSIAPAESSSAPPTKVHQACDFTWGYHGEIGGDEAFLRLASSGAELKGRYSWPSGRSVPLTGNVSSTHEVTLSQDDGGQKATFVGTCDVAGVFAGERRDAKGAARAFHFEVAAALEKPFVVTKKFEIVQPVKTVGPFGMKECSYKQTGFEIYGAHTLDAERAINGGGAESLTMPSFDLATANEVAVCEMGIDAEFGRTVVASWSRFVNVLSSGSINADGAAHPSNFVGFSRVTYDLDTGRAVTEADVFASFPKALVARCVASYPAPFPDGNIGDEVDGHTFALTAEGVLVFADDYPHYAAALTGRGPIITYGALLAAGALRADSPVKRAWANVAPAKAGEKECLPDSEDD